MIFKSLQDAIGIAANLRPDSRAFLGGGCDISYRQLEIDILLVSRFVMSQGLTAGARTGIVMRSDYLHAVLILALDRLGMASLSFNNINGDVVNQPWVQNLKLDCVFSVTSKPQGSDVLWVELNPELQELEIAPEFLEIEVPVDDDPARITRLISSSGTTGTPKVVSLDRELVLKRVLAHQLFCEGMGPNRYLLGMPYSTVAGYGWFLMAMCRGATVVPGLGPKICMRYIEMFQISHLLLTPNLFRNMVEFGHRKGRSFDSVCMTTTGGSPFDVQLVNKARSVLGPNILNAYASTETGSVAKGHIGLIDEDPNLVGPVLPFVDLQIVDEQDNPLPTGETGIVRIASELAVDQYENDPDENQVFRNGFVYSGDLGSLDNRYRLRILGRADELINLRGVKLMPEKIERPIANLEGVIDAAAFQADLGKGLRVCLAVVVDGDPSIKELTKEANKLLGQLAPQHIFVVSELPRNAMGKVMRHELASQIVIASRVKS